jgi:NAD(P)-dependent dehydrogenase (short-subunit alcohol dehydrogenase family)
MSGNGQRVAIITGGSQGIGASAVTAYRGLGWAVAANALTIKPSRDPDVLTVEGDIAVPATPPTTTPSWWGSTSPGSSG